MLVLASSSPRRIELLQKWGYDFRLVRPVAEEKFAPEDLPEDVVRELACRKALSGLDMWQCAQETIRDVILGADTVVVLGRKVLGKPRNKEEARAMLQALSGKTHKVMTAIALVGVDLKEQVETDVEVEVTTVSFRELSTKEILDYIATEEPMDKAAAYAIQGQAGRFVRNFNGSLTNVIGLPMELLTRKLKEKNIFPKGKTSPA